MNKKLIAVIAVIILICIVSVFVIVKKESSTSDNPLVIKGEDNSQTDWIIIRAKNTNYNNDSSKIYVSSSLPQFENLGTAYNNFINDRITNDSNYLSVYNSLASGLADGETGEFDYKTSYERYDCGSYISLVVNQYILFGDSRPISKKKCYVVDSNNKRTAVLEDVFKNKVSYKKRVVAEVNRQAEEAGIELVGGKGITSISEMQAFYIKDNKLHIYFEAAEIAAAAYGELDFELDFEMVDGKF